MHCVAGKINPLLCRGTGVFHERQGRRPMIPASSDCVMMLSFYQILDTLPCIAGEICF